jgi:hypothetical protein
MATSRGKKRSDANPATPPVEDPPPDDRTSPIPELMRRVLSVGLSGFFLTEEAVRKALGDTLPKDWTDFAVEQSERTRKEFLERLTYEMARTLESVNLADVLRELLEGRTLEIQAKVRLDAAGNGVRFTVDSDDTA